jgi:hypothetical protein
MVSHEGSIIGPVSTNRLLRRILHGKVPDASLVRERGWAEWRHVERIREVAALRREQAQHGEVEVPKARYWPSASARTYRSERLRRTLRLAGDPGEVLLVSLGEIMRVTDARVGAVHRRRAPYVGFVTSSACGPGMYSHLGHVIRGDDASMIEASQGHCVCLPPHPTDASRRNHERLGFVPASAGVVMVPIVIADRVYAFFELGRADHPFRRVDLEQVRLVVSAAAERLETVQNPYQSAPSPLRFDAHGAN